MHAQNFIIDQCSDRQTIKAVSEDLPQFDAMSALALIVETVDPIDRCTLVIASQQEEILWVLYFVGEQEAHCLKRLLSTVDVVTQEQVVGIRWEATILKQSK